MPAARTSNARHSRQPLQTHTAPNVGHEVIVVSDSDSPPPRKVKKTSRDSRVRPRTKARHVPPSSGEIIELNDSGDEVSAPRQKKSSSVSSQEARNKALEEVSFILVSERTDATHVYQENRHLKEEIKRLSAAAAYQRPMKGASPSMEVRRMLIPPFLFSSLFSANETWPCAQNRFVAVLARRSLSHTCISRPSSAHSKTMLHVKYARSRCGRRTCKLSPFFSFFLCYSPRLPACPADTPSASTASKTGSTPRSHST